MISFASFVIKVLLLIPDDELRNTIAADMSGLNGSIERWNMMNKRINEFFKRSNKSTKTSVNILNEIMLQVYIFKSCFIKVENDFPMIYYS